MDTSSRQHWIRATLLIGILYFVIGRLFALPGLNQPVWRLAAWMVSFAVFAVHIEYEVFKLRSGLRSMALHVAVAVGIGAFALAAAILMHPGAKAPVVRFQAMLALVGLPVVVGLAAFVVALLAGAVLIRASRSD